MGGEESMDRKVEGEEKERSRRDSFENGRRTYIVVLISIL